MKPADYIALNVGSLVECDGVLFRVTAVDPGIRPSYQWGVYSPGRERTPILMPQHSSIPVRLGDDAVERCSLVFEAPEVYLAFDSVPAIFSS
jgi:hypothetical protein